MATKNELRTDIQGVFISYEGVFNLIGFDQDALFKYLNSFESYKDLHRLNRFIFTKLKNTLLVLSMVYSKLPPDTWKNLRATAKKQRQVVQLNLAIKDFKSVWNRREKPSKPIKGHEPRKRRGRQYSMDDTCE